MARGGEQLVGDGVAAELLEEFVDSAIEGIDGGTEGTPWPGTSGSLLIGE